MPEKLRPAGGCGLLKASTLKVNIGKTQEYEILKKKTEILMRWENCGNAKIKRELMKTANEDVNEIVWERFVSVRAKNHRVSGPMVQEYAKQVAQKLGKTEFKASNGWLESSQKTSDSF